jgi:hypothetical protein
MSHDPMCRRKGVTEALMGGCPECDLIAQVRQDEGSRYVGAAQIHWDAGYGFGLNDAREAIQDVDPPSESYDDWHPKGKRLALEAIAAIKGDQP